MAAALETPPASRRRGARFWNRIAGRYALRPLDHPDAYEQKLDMIRARLTPEMTLLEFGCGTGSTAIRLAPSVKEICATDFAPRMLEIARERAAAADASNIRFEEVGIEEFPLTEPRYDAIMTMSLLHLLRNWRGAIGKIHDLLKPGGVFVSSTMCLRDEFGFVRPIAPIARALGFFPRLSFFRESELKEAMRAAGFDIVEEWRPGRRQALFLIAVKRD